MRQILFCSITTTQKRTKIIQYQNKLLRSGTSIGANINEAQYGNSKSDFISKLHISLKETGESIYWIKLLKNTKLLNEQESNKLLFQAEKIKRMLISSLNTAKKSINNK